jgi:peptidoglycan/LPS O-acetylase OafA/YrhL
MTAGNTPSFLNLSQGRDNNLSLVRFLAATFVVVSHSLALFDANEYDIMLQNFDTGYGDLGVNIFFVISGYLITKSWFRKQNLVDFCWARFLRIFPALWLSAIFAVLIAGLFFSPKSFIEFIGLDTTISYVLKNTTMLPTIGAQLELPAAIGDWDGHFNVPLWTLPHELQMYGLVVLLGIVGLLRFRTTCVVITAVIFAAWLASEFEFVDLNAARFRLMYHFFVGATVFHFADRLSFGGRSTSLAVLACLLSTWIFGPRSSEFVVAIFTPTILFWVGYYPAGFIRNFNKLGDYSYGIYIIGYPIQVMFFYYLGSRLNAFTHFFLSMSLLLVLAALSWHFVESKALRATIPKPLQFARSWLDRNLPFMNVGLFHR